MLENLLDAARKQDPQHSLDPLPALVAAASQLYDTAQRAGAAEAADLNTVKAQILGVVDSIEAGAGGSAQQVRNVIDPYLKLAADAGYNLANADVRLKFAYFVIEIVKEGFAEKKAGGTTRG